MKSVSLIATIISLFVVPAFGTTIHVPVDQPTIQAGIDTAEEGDTVFVAPGTYQGLGNGDIDFGGKNIVVMSEGGPEVTIIDCSATEIRETYRGFIFQSGEDSTSVVSGFTITGCYPHDAPFCPDTGAAILIINSSPTIVNNTITDNSCATRGGNKGAGGGIYCRGGSPLIKDCRIINNRANSGGAIFCAYANPVISGNLVQFNEGAAQLFEAGLGGGILCFDSNPTIEYNTISHNETQDAMGGYGGVVGVGCFGESQAVIRFNVFDSNTGTAVSVLSATIVNNTFIRNAGEQLIYVDGLSSTIESNIIAFNLIVASPGNAMYDGIVPLNNNNIYENSDDTQHSEFLDSLIGTNCNISANPLFCDTASGDLHISSASPCTAENSPCGELIGALEVGCIPTGIEDPCDLVLPTAFALQQNFPNPFNPMTTITYSLPERANVTLDIFNVLGQCVRSLVHRKEPAGLHTVIWDGTDNDGRPAASGTYLYRLQAAGYVDTKKMLLLK